MPPIKKVLLSVFLVFSIILISLPIQPVPAKASDYFSFIVLSQYKAVVDIGDEFYLAAVTSNGKLPSWKSSNSTIVSINTYGKVTAKKSGTATVTAKIKNAEASCRVTVNKTVIMISQTDATIERGENLVLTATTSNNSAVTWKSSRNTIATIDEYGTVTGIKPGGTTITASADGSSTTCKITVRIPTVTLNRAKITLYRGQSAKLYATVSSGMSPAWKTNKRSIATVDNTGTITAVKHGTATITATVDGVSKTCEVVVKQPIVSLNTTELKLKKGESAVITATISSGNLPTWSSSNQNVARVDSKGKVTALQKGRAYIYASEDGVKLRCTLYVTE